MYILIKCNESSASPLKFFNSAASGCCHGDFVVDGFFVHFYFEIAFEVFAMGFDKQRKKLMKEYVTRGDPSKATLTVIIFVIIDGESVQDKKNR